MNKYESLDELARWAREAEAPDVDVVDRVMRVLDESDSAVPPAKKLRPNSMTGRKQHFARDSVCSKSCCRRIPPRGRRVHRVPTPRSGDRKNCVLPLQRKEARRRTRVADVRSTSDADSFGPSCRLGDQELQGSTRSTGLSHSLPRFAGHPRRCSTGAAPREDRVRRLRVRVTH